MGFADRLKEARIARGLTQQQVADAMGITNSTYCGYETQKRQPDVPKIKKLSRILQVSADELLETGFSPKQEFGESDPNLKFIVDTYNNSNQEGKSLLVEQARLVSESPRFDKRSNVPLAVNEKSPPPD